MPKDLTDDDLKRYYSIGEVAKLLDVSTTKIRYWDKEFSHLKPTKNSRGDRRFTKDNLRQLRQIDHLLNDRGFTIEGARREIAATKGKATTATAAKNVPVKTKTVDNREVIDRLKGVRRLLAGLLEE